MRSATKPPGSAVLRLLGCCDRGGTHLHLVETTGLDRPDDLLGSVATHGSAASLGMTKPTLTQYEWKGRKLRHLPTGRQWTWGSDFVTRGSEVSPDGRHFDPGELDALAVKLMAKKARAEHW